MSVPKQIIRMRLLCLSVLQTLVQSLNQYHWIYHLLEKLECRTKTSSIYFGSWIEQHLLYWEKFSITQDLFATGDDFINVGCKVRIIEIAISICTLACAQLFEKLFTGIKVGREGVGCKNSLWNWPQVTRPVEQDFVVLYILVQTAWKRETAWQVDRFTKKTYRKRKTYKTDRKSYS